MVEFYQGRGQQSRWHIICREETLIMRPILVVNPKGGSGKTTIATNLAGFFAALSMTIFCAVL